MPVRPLRPIDVVALGSFSGRASETELTAHTWPRVEPESGRLPLLTLASAALTHRVAGERVWLARGDGKVAGFVIGRTRAGGLAWDVERLHASPDDDQVAVELLERLVSYAGGHGARRVFLETPEHGRGQDVARRARFERFTSTTLYMLAPRFEVKRTELFEARPRLRADEQALFQLYLAAVPAPVRAAEALTLEEWAALHRGAHRWQPSLGGSRQQYVWELGTSIVGWMEITFGQRSQFIDLLVHPRYEEAADRLLRYALLQASPKVPVYVSARDYQASLAGALEQAGFAHAGRHGLYVKMLAARVPEARLVPAKVVGG
jgi:hypothetical protein